MIGFLLVAALRHLAVLQQQCGTYVLSGRCAMSWAKTSFPWCMMVPGAAAKKTKHPHCGAQIETSLRASVRQANQQLTPLPEQNVGTLLF